MRNKDNPDQNDEQRRKDAEAMMLKFAAVMGLDYDEEDD
jgi:hypothetical protein